MMSITGPSQTTIQAQPQYHQGHVPSQQRLEKYLRKGQCMAINILRKNSPSTKETVPWKILNQETHEWHRRDCAALSNPPPLPTSLTATREKKRKEKKRKEKKRKEKKRKEIAIVGHGRDEEEKCAMLARLETAWIPCIARDGEKGVLV
ncbi:hypothetical protein K505DRAFT_323802 [Melanomma pulvis-pyrius CBS 109.77]|uniref:Uncharacterized protein n=1 Tax=Melanomma pulvis-pyrius CBS 109.77 TaxID=1314802 RepID=A0A6A6XJT6_9PLEO|nr:hypothetical protein K505DRAFT_323802 [Melanomma pulvis-pyrius CBS 109.77]